MGSSLGRTRKTPAAQREAILVIGSEAHQQLPGSVLLVWIAEEHRCIFGSPGFRIALQLLAYAVFGSRSAPPIPQRRLSWAQCGQHHLGLFDTRHIQRKPNAGCQLVSAKVNVFAFHRR